MSNVALRCTNAACAARGEVQSSKTCAVCGRPTEWSVLRVPPPGAAQIGPIYTTPMPPKHQAPAHQAGLDTRTCTNEGCARFRLAVEDPFCGACGHATVAAKTI